MSSFLKTLEKLWLFEFLFNETEASGICLFLVICCTAVQQNCISLPKFAICENADHPQSHGPLGLQLFLHYF